MGLTNTLLIAIVVELAVALELLRRNVGAAGGLGWTPWRFKIYDAITGSYVVLVLVLAGLLAVAILLINYGMTGDPL